MIPGIVASGGVLGNSIAPTGPGDSSQNGFIACEDAVYALAREGVGSLGLSTGGQVGQAFVDTGEGFVFDCWQTFLKFDTDGLTVDTATLKIAVVADFSDPDFTIQAYLFDYGTLTTADFRSGTVLAAMTIAASLSTSGISPGLVTLVNNGTVLRDGINTSGFTRLVVVSSRQVNNNEPSGFEYITMNIADCRLEIT